MGKPTGFLQISRQKPVRRPVAERVRDYCEFEGTLDSNEIRDQASRCMDCGVPFCHHGCPLGNVIPDWNDLVYRGRWREASESLHATNNFPEFTGRICPAPCEESCVLNLSAEPVTIRQIEVQIVDRAFDQGWIVPRPASQSSGHSVAVVGSGPAGLACAQQLARAGHRVTVFERDDRLGGLLRYGIPDFKLDKHQLDRRLEQLSAEGIVFRTGVNVGVDHPVDQLRAEFDAICLAAGAHRARDLPVPGRGLRGVHFAMEYLEQANRAVAGDPLSEPITAANKKVVILGGGDTGADCLGTAHRQGAASVHQLELLPRPPSTRTGEMPWPNWPMVFRTSGAHEEGGMREFSVCTKAFSGDEHGRVRRLHAARLDWHTDAEKRTMTEVAGSAFELEAQLVLLALGFAGAEPGGVIQGLGLSLDERGAVPVDSTFMTAVPGVFACGDMHRGQSLVVWAIREGRDAAAGINTWLRARTVRAAAGVG